ncbi:hypothetical protein V5799_011361 [Amblyomma americanum]|uniref:Ran gtpase-activating protein n=1 Tax=Amblyomma americanum TaxID=6943 RepID=A0AAQ4EH57_AMBAM
MQPSDLRRRGRSSDSVSGMASWRGRLWEYTTYLVRHCPSLCPSSNQLFSNLRHLRSILSQGRINHDAPCTAGDPDGCNILADLTIWNEFLWVIDFELREVGPGRLALCWLRGRVMPVASDMQRRHSLVLVHWLLTEHRCLEYVELCESRMSRSHFLFRDGLRLSHGLRHVKLCYNLLYDYPPRDLMDALSSTIATLNTLEVVSVRFSAAGVVMLCELLGRCSALRTLILHENELSASDAGALMKSCADCRGLKAVRVDESFVSAECARVLGDLVLENQGLEELVVSQFSPAGTQARACSFRELFNALAHQSTMLRNLEIYNFELEESDLRCLCRALTVNSKMKRLTLLCSGASEDAYFSLGAVISNNVSLTEISVNACLLPSWSLKAVASAIETNVSLRKLSFNDACLIADQAVELLGALLVNRTLERLNLGCINQPGLRNFLKRIDEKDLRNRLELTVVYGSAQDLIYSLNHDLKTPSVSFIPAAQIREEEFLGLSRGLCGNSSITSLSVHLNKAIDSNLAVLLSAAFASCRHVRAAHLCFPTEASEAVTILQGMAKSPNLCDLVIRRWTFEHREAAAFGDMLRATQTLNSVTLEELQGDSGAFLVMELPRALETNYTLLALNDCEHTEDEQNMFEIRDALRRNLSLLQRATRFVVPPVSDSKKAASAFEKVRKSRALVTNVSRLSGLSEPEAVEAVKLRGRYLDENFMALARVVKHKVVCEWEGAGDRPVQLDEIGLDCWLRLRPYLRLDDIL